MVDQLLDGTEESSRKTLEEIKTFFRNMMPEDIYKGAWFEKLLYLALSNYQKKVTAE